MRIGIDTRFLHLGLTHSKEMDLLGGVAGYLYYLVLHLLEAEEDDSFVLLADESRPIEPFQKLVQDRPNVELLPAASPFHMPLVDGSIGAAVRMAQDRLLKIPMVNKAGLDVLHTHEDVLGLTGTDTREVVSIHSFLARRVLTEGIGKYVWHRKLDRFRRASRLVAISSSLSEDIVDCLGVDPDRVTTIHHGYDSNIFRPIDAQDEVSARLTEYGVPEEFLLYVGGLAPEKNVPNLLRGYRAAAEEYGVDLPLVMCGLMPKFYKREFLRVTSLIRQLGIRDRVNILHYVPHRDLPAFYNRASLVLSPSYSEGFGLVPLEAMACGAPVVVSNRPAIPEIVGNAGYYVDPDDIDEIAQGVYKVVHDTTLRTEMRERGQERAECFTWKKCVRETLSLYRDVANVD